MNLRHLSSIKLLSVVALVVALLLALPATADKTKPVEVLNFPDVQNVNVGNLPAVQDVSIIDQTLTHMGQAPKEHVVLNFFDIDQNCIEGLPFKRIFPDGTLQSFAIPAGRLLVVTDFNVTAFIPDPFPVKASVELILRLGQAGKTSGEIAYRSSFHLTSDLSSQNFTITGALPAGILVGSKGSLCPQMNLDGGNNGKLIVTAGNYRGYVIDDTEPRRR